MPTLLLWDLLLPIFHIGFSESRNRYCCLSTSISLCSEDVFWVRPRKRFSGHRQGSSACAQQLPVQCRCMAHLDISPSTGQGSLLFRSQAAFICFLPLLLRKISSILHSPQASPFMVHYIHWLILLSLQYVGHHPHLYALTFSTYFLSGCLSLTVSTPPEFSPNHSVLFLFYSFFAEKKMGFFLIKDTHYLIRSFISPSSFIMELVYYQHFFLQISGEISLSYPPSNSYGEQVLFCFLFF